MSASVEETLRGNLDRVWGEWVSVNRDKVINARVKDGMDEDKKRKAQELGQRWIAHIDREVKRVIRRKTHPMAISLWMMNMLNEIGMELSMGIDGFHLDPGPYDEQTSRSLALALWACFQYQFPGVAERG